MIPPRPLNQDWQIAFPLCANSRWFEDDSEGISSLREKRCLARWKMSALSKARMISGTHTAYLISLIYMTRETILQIFVCKWKIGLSEHTNKSLSWTPKRKCIFLYGSENLCIGCLNEKKFNEMYSHFQAIS